MITEAILPAIPGIAGIEAAIDSSGAGRGVVIAAVPGPDKNSKTSNVEGPQNENPDATDDVYELDEFGMPAFTQDQSELHDGAVGRQVSRGSGLMATAFRGSGSPQGIGQTVPALPATRGNADQNIPFQTYNIESQNVDSKGWVNRFANSRVARYMTWGSRTPQNNPYWMGLRTNGGRLPVASGSQNATVYTGNGSFNFGGGSVDSMWTPEGQDIMYEPPGPPTSTTGSGYSTSADPAEEYF